MTLILGGARSGKSRRAQRLAEAASERRIYVATAEPLDDEMKARVAHHQAERGAGWRTVEAPLEIAEALDRLSSHGEVILIDCLTLWLSNLMHHGRDVTAETEKLCDTLQRFLQPVFLVSNEVGLGLVPETPLGRAFRDAQGRLNQQMAETCDVVEFIAAGLPLRLKG